MKNKSQIEIENLKSAIEKEKRSKDIAIILSAVKFKTADKRSKILEILSNSDLSIDTIKETYDPITYDKTASIN
jgi:hypothetical protein